MNTKMKILFGTTAIAVWISIGTAIVTTQDQVNRKLMTLKINYVKLAELC